MHSDSRKAQHNSFAHQRARLLFSKLPGDTVNREIGSTTSAAERTLVLRARVRACLLYTSDAADE